MTIWRIVIDNYLALRTNDDEVSKQWTDSFLQLMRYEDLRLRTFSDSNFDDCFKKKLARAGLFFLHEDKVQCAFCRGVISRWFRNERPLLEHALHFPRCPFIMEEDVGNVPIGDDPLRGANVHYCI